MAITITVDVKHGGLAETILRGPTLHRQPNLDKAKASRWTYGLEPDNTARLTPLGVLHSLIGLTLNFPDDEDGD